MTDKEKREVYKWVFKNWGGMSYKQTTVDKFRYFRRPKHHTIARGVIMFLEQNRPKLTIEEAVNKLTRYYEKD